MEVAEVPELHFSIVIGNSDRCVRNKLCGLSGGMPLYIYTQALPSGDRTAVLSKPE
jgi:hypothetical protein